MFVAAYETNKSHLQVLYVSTYRLESMYCLDICVFGQLSNFLIVNKLGLQAVKGIGTTTFVVFTKAGLPPVSVSSNFYRPDTEGARLRRAMQVRCNPGLRGL